METLNDTTANVPGKPAAQPTREDWLLRAVDSLSPLFGEHGCPFPANLHVSVGFPSVGALRRRSPHIGECWAPQASADGRPHLFISPVVGDPVVVLAVLVHELIHAAVGGAAGHGPLFRRPARALGLRGPMTATHASDPLSRMRLYRPHHGHVDRSGPADLSMWNRDVFQRFWPVVTPGRRTAGRRPAPAF